MCENNVKKVFVMSFPHPHTSFHMPHRTRPGSTKIISFILGPLLFGAALLFIPDSFSFNAKAALGLLLWMCCWWVMLPVPVSVTAFLPIVMNSFLDLVPMSSVTSKFFSEIVVLLLGADMLSLSWEKCGLDKRLAMRALCIIGPKIRQQIIIWFVLATVLSMFLPNAVVCAVMIPIAISMLKFVGETDIPSSRVAAVIMVAITWGSGIGGLGTPLGGAMNLVAVDYFENLTGQEYAYASWTAHLLPFLILLCACNLLLLFTIKLNKKELPGSRYFFEAEYAKLPPMNRDEQLSLFLFIVATLLAFLRPLYSSTLPGMKPAYVFLLLGLLTTIIPSCKEDRATLLGWSEAEKGILWGLLFIFAGGTALGTIITDTGAADAIAQIVSNLNLTGGLVTIFVFTVFTILLAETASNTAAAAISLPIVISVTQAAGLDPIPYIYIAAAAFNTSYMLPTSIRAIPIGHGLSPSFLFRHGLKQTIAGAILITLLGWIFMTYWPYFNAV
jgi:sodium-dependent dicarboxylate transporter 2/3/5